MSAFFMECPVVNPCSPRYIYPWQAGVDLSRTRLVPGSYQVRSIFELLETNITRACLEFG